MSVETSNHFKRGQPKRQTSRIILCGPHASMGMKGKIFVLGPTYVDQNIPQLQFTLFPNPVNDILSIKISQDLIGSSFSVWDITEKIVLTGQFDKDQSQLIVERLNPGVYFFKCDARVSILRRFIKN